jgi:hypothetical protein
LKREFKSKFGADHGQVTAFGRIHESKPIITKALNLLNERAVALRYGTTIVGDARSHPVAGKETDGEANRQNGKNKFRDVRIHSQEQAPVCNILMTMQRLDCGNYESTFTLVLFVLKSSIAKKISVNFRNSDTP